jgi:hypothetical protein
MKLENLKKLKPVKKPSKLRRWISGINAKLAGRYVNDIHPGFMTYLEKNNFLTASIWRDACVKKYKKIWKILDSDKYRKFFYKAINYNPAVKEKPIIDTRWHVVTYNKITYFLSKAYVFLFERGLYRKIKFFEKVSSEYADLSTRIDKYIASTTFEERLSRMHATGVLSDKSFQEYRMMSLKNVEIMQDMLMVLRHLVLNGLCEENCRMISQNYYTKHDKLP